MAGLWTALAPRDALGDPWDVKRLPSQPGLQDDFLQTVTSPANHAHDNACWLHSWGPRRRSYQKDRDSGHCSTLPLHSNSVLTSSCTKSVGLRHRTG